MGIICGILLGGVAAISLYAMIAGTIEDEKRKNTPCNFTDGISRKQFMDFVNESAKQLKRLKSFSVDGSIVHGQVVSQSGQSEWQFSIDFNDYGHITGNYWIRSDNSDSNLPDVLADKIKARIISCK